MSYGDFLPGIHDRAKDRTVAFLFSQTLACPGREAESTEAIGLSR